MGQKTRLICLEGCDGTGKTTQAALLLERLTAAGERARKLKFPDYESLSSGPVRLYLKGKLSADPDGVNPYAASVLYAADRLCSYKENWEADYKSGTVFVTDRYVTSNLIYQTPKLAAGERDSFLEWEQDLEYVKMGLPRPDLVFYLDLPAEIGESRVKGRSHRTGQQPDIHETNMDYQAKVNRFGRGLAERLGWRVIQCAPLGRLRTAEEIAGEIWTVAEQRLYGK